MSDESFSDNLKEKRTTHYSKKKLQTVLVIQKKGLPLHPQTRKQLSNAKNAEIAQLVEHNLAKVRVASSSLVFRSKGRNLT